MNVNKLLKTILSQLQYFKASTQRDFFLVVYIYIYLFINAFCTIYSASVVRKKIVYFFMLQLLLLLKG